MQIIQHVEEDSEGGFCHKLLHFDISPLVQNQICIGSLDTISVVKRVYRETRYMWEAFSTNLKSDDFHFDCK